ncbi:butyrophilin subfamily 1 member A1-like isoform X2 [Ornithorhynchus anatinus]|uniref:Butyrophilin subfamily 1 member A1-like n=3 Tax=Ornithorhynchus anatinus TaxID=9258 RepID=A0A6I8PH15_ORNAN|nr:butyrophilin subfamily 1 member A1-like isoform X2 [Ornithorhynchus anatinus]XP_028911849.1 butyrophilin subfamily 1 member A1-like isoform X2 [Ornithorhynchus anatinus]XP_039766653.1 butyrophilin subfamily 1 member A1-like isoform X2 [Ornithorhynchus anatinus]XP_039766654.1 butyrophilin subfamily 1 member A1-like isoform X2 [Ornithorhynchus anatinus]
MVGFPESFTTGYLLLLLLFFLHLSTLGSAQFSVIGPAEPILALEGEDADLRCHLDPKMSAEPMQVRWFRSEFSNIVHLYDNGEDKFEDQMEEYQRRTELVTDAMDYGSVAVRIHSVRVSDEGKFRCFFVNDQMYEDALLELQVVAPLFPTALSLMVALGVTLPVLGLLITGGLYLIWKHPRDKGKLQIELRWSRGQLHMANVTLDPDSAYRFLVLSEDGKRVTVGFIRQDLPDKPERFSDVWCVLGRECFTSGTHCWAVDVEDATVWSLGVCRENVRRKGKISESPADGLWAVKKEREQYWALTSPRVPLSLTTSPRRVVVYLDCEAGDVSFYNGTDGSHIYTFPRAAFSGTLRPFFRLYYLYQSLKICPVPGGEGENPVPAPAQETPVTPPGQGPASVAGDGDPLPGAVAPLLPPQPGSGVPPAP